MFSWRGSLGVVTAAGLLSGLLLVAAPAEASPVQEAPPALANISPDLGGVVVDSAGFRTASGQYELVKVQLADVQRTRQTAEIELAGLAAQDVALTAAMQADTARKKAAAVELAQLRERFRQLALAGYVSGQGAASSSLAPDIAADTAAKQRGALVQGLSETSAGEQAVTEAGFRATLTRIDTARTKRTEVRTRTVQVTAMRDQAATDEVRLTAELEQRHADLLQTRALSVVVGADLTLVAMDAYYTASRTLAASNPKCGIPWWALAGIGRVESRHGTYGGTALLANGDEARPIIGIPLDGTNDTTVVGDTDGGTIDGDPTVDRAVGPMQFIPSTWARYRRDGNGDGRIDPQNIYDAALAAGVYLCRSAPLTDDDGLGTAYYRYNHSDAYVRTVLAWAHRYEALVIPAPPPSL